MQSSLQLLGNFLGDIPPYKGNTEQDRSAKIFCFSRDKIAFRESKKGIMHLIKAVFIHLKGLTSLKSKSGFF